MIVNNVDHNPPGSQIRHLTSGMRHHISVKSGTWSARSGMKVSLTTKFSLPGLSVSLGYLSKGNGQPRFTRETADKTEMKTIFDVLTSISGSISRDWVLWQLRSDITGRNNGNVYSLVRHFSTQRVEKGLQCMLRRSIYNRIQPVTIQIHLLIITYLLCFFV